MIKHFLTTLFFITMICFQSYAQKTIVEVPDFFETSQEGTLNDAVQAAIDANTLSNTIFKLKPYGAYVLTGTITTPAGETLEIVADPPGTTQDGAPPMICWTASTAPTKTYIFDVPGVLKMENVTVLWASLDGTRYNSTIRVGDSASVSGGRCDFTNVLFDYVNQNSSGAIQVFATNFKGFFKNCYFRNATDDHFRYYSRAVSFNYNTTGLHIDSVMFENCTFANIGYVYMQEGGEYGDNVFFNHCTFYNVVMFPLESGWWWKMYVTNSLFINTFMFGAIPETDGEGFGGTIAITPIDSNSLGAGFGFTVPFTEQERRILFANNNYYVDQWLVDWMGYGPNGSPYSKAKHQARLDSEIPVPMPMMNGATKTFFDSVDNDGNKAYPYMNRANLDSINPGFINPPINVDSLKAFLNYKWDTNADVNWAWKPENSYNQIWPLEESLAYTSEELRTAGMGGFPLGDIYRWWPEQYAAWESQKDEEYNYINHWLETGDSVLVSVRPEPGIPSEFNLGQNYPNPFNPVTQIKYSVPVSGQVSLKVYNTLGQLVATLFEGNQQIGNYVAEFNAVNLASGVYIYELKSENVILSKKLILMK